VKLRFLTAATAGVAALAVLSALQSPAQARPPVEDGLYASSTADFCASVQAVTASISNGQAKKLPLTNVVNTSESAFVLSKSSDVPFTTQQYETVDANGDPFQIYCKGRSVDAIRSVYGDVTGEEAACSDVLELQLRHVWKSLSPAERRTAVYDKQDVVIDEDELASIGPVWANFAQPFPTIRAEDDGTLHLQGHSLLVPLSNPAPVPITFKGNHYCTLPHPDRLRRALLEGLPTT
jgi:hypothetical protein